MTHQLQVSCVSNTCNWNPKTIVGKILAAYFWTNLSVMIRLHQGLLIETSYSRAKPYCCQTSCLSSTFEMALLCSIPSSMQGFPLTNLQSCTCRLLVVLKNRPTQADCGLVALERWVWWWNVLLQNVIIHYRRSFVNTGEASKSIHVWDVSDYS